MKGECDEDSEEPVQELRVFQSVWRFKQDDALQRQGDKEGKEGEGRYKMSRWTTDSIHTPYALNEEAIGPIKEYCKKRNYRCSGCRFSIKKFVQDPGYSTCIFSNCPCSWREEKDD